MTSNLATVQAIYEAFGKGDVPAIISHLAEDVQWESWANNTAQKAGVPWLKSRNNKAGVIEFFQVVASLNIQDFKVLSIMGGETQVAVEFTITFIAPATGQNVKDEEMHLWTFNKAGKVTRFRHYLDTNKHIVAAGVEAAVLK
ncbi:MAG: nuclear transport factor 2 family protein [Saprospiraceae bacterium]